LALIDVLAIDQYRILPQKQAAAMLTKSCEPKTETIITTINGKIKTASTKAFPVLFFQHRQTF
jgi:hypothetical protein